MACWRQARSRPPMSRRSPRRCCRGWHPSPPGVGDDMRIVVVGGGVIGLLTAVECVRAGALVDLVDRADIPAQAAASYDRHRVVRTLHRGDAALTSAAARLDERWLEVESLLGGRFYHRTGVLTAMHGRDMDATSAL